MRHLALAAALLPVLAAPAAAAERPLSEVRASSVIAHGPYASWTQGQSSKRVLWHDGRVSKFPWTVTTDITFGSDSARRVVALGTACDSATKVCSVRQRALGSGGWREVYRIPKGRDRPVAALHRGTLALATGPSMGPHGIYVRARGSSKLRRVAAKVPRPRAITTNGRQVAFHASRTGENDLDEIRVIDIESGDDRVFAQNDSFDNDCRCTNGSSRISTPIIAGSYLYWLESHFPAHMSGDQSAPRTQIGRARMDIEDDPRIEYYDTADFATSYAIRGDRIVYSADSGGVFEVKKPDWRATGWEIPART